VGGWSKEGSLVDGWEHRTKPIEMKDLRSECIGDQEQGSVLRVGITGPPGDISCDLVGWKVID
jgi:hypothetical protein